MGSKGAIGYHAPHLPIMVRRRNGAIRSPRKNYHSSSFGTLEAYHFTSMSMLVSPSETPFNQSLATGAHLGARSVISVMTIRGWNASLSQCHAMTDN